MVRNILQVTSGSIFYKFNVTAFMTDLKIIINIITTIIITTTTITIITITITITITRGHVRPERVNKWPNSTKDR
jgi:hypothetical protein